MVLRGLGNNNSSCVRTAQIHHHNIFHIHLIRRSGLSRGRGFLRLDSRAADQMQLGRTAAVPTAVRSRRLTHVVVTASATGQEPSTSGRPQQPRGAPPQAQRRMPTGPNGRPLIMGPEGQPVEVRLGQPSLLVGIRLPKHQHTRILSPTAADGAPRRGP